MYRVAPRSLPPAIPPWAPRRSLAASRRGHRDWTEKRPELRDLQEYLTMSAPDRGRELAAGLPGAFVEWLEAAAVGGGPRRWSPRQRRMLPHAVAPSFVRRFRKAHEEGDDTWSVLAKLPDWLMKEWADSDEARTASYDDPFGGQSFMNLDFRRQIPRQWLVHFSERADDIACKGFLRGTENRAELSSNWQAKEDRRGPGYNFAYLPSNADHSGYALGVHRRARSKAVLFTAPGVLVDNSGDQEKQVIFWGADARQYVAATRDEYTDLWQVGEVGQGRPAFQAKKLDEIADWLAVNYRQYKKYLTCRGTSPEEDRAAQPPEWLKELQRTWTWLRNQPNS